IFIDADTTVPLDFFSTLLSCVIAGASGGAVRGDYKPQKGIIRLYSRFWDWYAARSSLPMTQGICQYVERSLFDAINGYDESLWFAEDTDFYWRLHVYAVAHRIKLAIPQSL